MAKEKVYKVSGEISKNAHIDEKKYKEMYARSINDSDVFWEEQAEEFITWFSKWDIIQEWNFSDITIEPLKLENGLSNSILSAKNQLNDFFL